MKRVLRKDSRTYEIAPWHQGQSSGTGLDFQDRQAALEFFRQLMTDSDARGILRALAMTEQYAALSDHEIAEQMAWRALSRQLRITEIAPSNETIGIGADTSDEEEWIPRKPKPAAAPTPPVVEEEPDWEVDDLIEFESEDEEAPEWVPPDAPVEDVEHLVLRCKHKRDGLQRSFVDPPYLAVVPTRGEETVEVLYRRMPTPPPDSVEVTDYGTVAASGEEAGHKIYAFEPESKKLSQDRSKNILARYWTGLNKPTTYTVKGLGRSVPIKCYEHGRWRLKCKFPAWNKLKYGTELGGSGLKEGLVHGGEDHSVKGFQFSLREYDSVVDLPDIVGVFAEVLIFAREFYKILKTVQDYTPKVGSYLDIQAQFLEGSVYLKWGWEEYSDYRAYFECSGTVDLKLINLMLEFGFGYAGIGCKAQIYAQLYGYARVKTDIKRSSPDGDATWEPIRQENLFKASIGARVEAGWRLKIQVSVESYIKTIFAIHISTKHPFVVDGSAEWSGLAADLEVSLGKGGKFGTENHSQVELMAARTLGHFKWPQKAKYKPEWMTASAIKSVVKSVITKGWNVRVKDVSDAWYKPNLSWTVDEIADALTGKIDSRTDILRGKEEVRAMMAEVRVRLDELGGRPWYQRDYIDSEELAAFIEQGEFDAILDGYVDPCLGVIEQLEAGGGDG